jgi:hypothetical protein
MKHYFSTILGLFLALALQGQCDYEIEKVVNPEGGYTTIKPKDQGKGYGHPISFKAIVDQDTTKFAFIYLTTSSQLTFPEKTVVSFQFEDDSFMRIEDISVDYVKTDISSADGSIYNMYSAFIELNAFHLSELSTRLVKNVWFGQTKSNEYMKGIRKKTMTAAKCLADL